MERNYVTVTLCVCDAKKAHTQSDSTGGSTDLKPWRTLKLTHRGPSADRDNKFIKQLNHFFPSTAYLLTMESVLLMLSLYVVRV